MPTVAFYVTVEDVSDLDWARLKIQDAIDNAIEENEERFDGLVAADGWEIEENGD